ncbi:MAG: hypothetical protein CMM52_01640 [Rhodospirillaceae bacterium]|nr:hypothetical protein [Rhodospirillaceae bacterium]|tara:strand:+ start:13455 stop:14675 length:1221 start_codon:yes stop_codon:yes gene_type:complete
MQEILNKHWTIAFLLIGPLAYFSVYALWIPIVLTVLFNLSRIKEAFWSDNTGLLKRCWPYFLLPVFGALSASWALVPSDALSTAAKLAVYILVAILVGLLIRKLTGEENRKIIYWTAAGLLIAFPVAVVDIALAGKISSLYKSYEFNPNMYSRGTAITAFLVIPVAMGLFRHTRPIFGVLFVAICLAMISGLYMEAAKLAIILGAGVFLLIRWTKKLFWPVVAVPMLIAFVFPAFFAVPLTEEQRCRLHYTMDSAHHRIMIYQFGTHKILEKPILGWGLDSSRSIPGGADRSNWINCIRPDGQPTQLNIGGNMPLHPHNAAIQIWLELGLVGSLILSGSVLLLVGRFKRDFVDNEGQAVVAASFCAACLIYNVSFGLWQSWLMFSMILLGGIVMTLQRSDGSRKSG